VTHQPATEIITPAGQHGHLVVPCSWQHGGPIGLASDTQGRRQTRRGARSRPRCGNAQPTRCRRTTRAARRSSFRGPRVRPSEIGQRCGLLSAIGVAAWWLQLALSRRRQRRRGRRPRLPALDGTCRAEATRRRSPSRHRRSRGAITTNPSGRAAEPQTSAQPIAAGGPNTNTATHARKPGTDIRGPVSLTDWYVPDRARSLIQ
jgi:hypothetical protein